jgi:hypothetical protein
MSRRNTSPSAGDEVVDGRGTGAGDVAGAGGSPGADPPAHAVMAALRNTTPGVVRIMLYRILTQWRRRIAD